MVHLISSLKTAPERAPTTERAPSTAPVKTRQSDTNTAVKSGTAATAGSTASFRALLSAKPAATVSETASRNSSSSAASTSAASGSAAASTDWRSLFTGRGVPAVPDPPSHDAPPTAESVFGPNPWLDNPTGHGPNGIAYSYNPIYFATLATAAKVAQMMGGTVVETYAITPFGPFQQQQKNAMVELPDGRLINAGLVASYFSHGWPQSLIDRAIAADVAGTNPT
jgi:hypothetical protein